MAREVLATAQPVAGAVLHDVADVVESQGPHDFIRAGEASIVDVQTDPLGLVVGDGGALAALGHQLAGELAFKEARLAFVGRPVEQGGVEFLDILDFDRFRSEVRNQRVG